jgi:hypothetical protein
MAPMPMLSFTLNSFKIMHSSHNKVLKRLGPSSGENAKDKTGVIQRSLGNGALANEPSRRQLN